MPMTTDPRWSCFRKKAYPDERVAKAVARDVRARSGVESIAAYRCEECGLFHIGRSRQYQTHTV